MCCAGKAGEVEGKALSPEGWSGKQRWPRTQHEALRQLVVGVEQEFGRQSTSSAPAAAMSNGARPSSRPKNTPKSC